MRELLTLICCISVAWAVPQSTRDIDWKNFSYPLLDTDSVPGEVRWMPPHTQESVALVNGQYVVPGDCGGRIGVCPSVSFESVNYGILSGFKSTVAVVALSYGTGGTANWQYVYVFVVESGQPRLVAWLRTGSRADEGLREVSISSGDLVLAVNDPAVRQGACCSAGTITTRYQWTGNAFAALGQPVRKIDPPSFDCTKAATPVEHLICKDARLSFLDSQMATSYERVLKGASLERKELIRRQQGDWFAEYSRSCNAALSDEQRRDCIDRHLSDRLNAIWQ